MLLSMVAEMDDVRSVMKIGMTNKVLAIVFPLSAWYTSVHHIKTKDKNRKDARMSSATRTYSLRPFACFDKKTGNGLDLHNVLEEVRNDATLCATEAFKHINHNI